MTGRNLILMKKKSLRVENNSFSMVILTMKTTSHTMLNKKNSELESNLVMIMTIILKRRKNNKKKNLQLQLPMLKECRLLCKEKKLSRQGKNLDR